MVFRYGRSQGHTVVERGSIIEARINGLRGSEALKEFCRWPEGLYHLHRGTPPLAGTTQFLVVGVSKQLRLYERWLEDRGVAVSVVDPKDLTAVLGHFDVDVIITPCPLVNNRVACASLKKRLRESGRPEPQILTFRNDGVCCGSMHEGCCDDEPSLSSLKERTLALVPNLALVG